MASFAMEEFLGEGSLKNLIPKLIAGGWDDVPTVKMMNPEDMDWIKLTRQQKDALEIRSYLHDRSLMEYVDRLEASRKPLAELLNISTSVLSSQFSMKRGHLARFIDRASACSIPPYTAPVKQRSLRTLSKTDSNGEPSRSMLKIQSIKSSIRGSAGYERSVEQSVADFKISEGYVFKGIVAAEPAEPRLCGCVQPPPIVDDVASYSSIENISVQRLTPEYKTGMERLVTETSPPLRASELWRSKPAILLCLRRPGCIMCRAEAHQVYARKPIFDALGFQLIAVLHEQIESEVRDFWPRYWGGAVVLDRSMDFFKALGGGTLLKDKFITGFVLNPRAVANYKRAAATGLDHNYRGKGEIKGGMFIIGSGRTGIAYQFIERNFGDWAPIAEVIEICSQMQSQNPRQGDSSAL